MTMTPNCVQRTPDRTLLFVLVQMSGAPDPDRWPPPNTMHLFTSHTYRPARAVSFMFGLLGLVLGLACAPTLALAAPADSDKEQLPVLDEQSAHGLQLHCSLVKKTFTVGEPVSIWCRVTNTTDRLKPMAWHPSAGSHYCLARSEASWMEGVLPLVIPQLSDAIKIRSAGLSPEYLLYLPPHSCVVLLLTYKPERPEKFKGRVVYDPMTHGGGFFGDDALEKAKQACVFSNTFDYEVTEGPNNR
jgi:hypothetical protein